MVFQINVFLGEQLDKMQDVTAALTGANISIRSFNISDSGELRLIVNRPEDALYVLKNKGYTVSKSAVIVAVVAEAIGRLDRTIGVLTDNNITVEYVYALNVNAFSDTIIVIKVDDTRKALEIYAKENMKILSPEEVYSFNG